MHTSLKRRLQQADNLRNSGRTGEAIKLYRQLFRQLDRSQEWEAAGSALQMIGVCYKIDNHTKESLAWLRRALRYFEQRGLKQAVGNTLRDIGITYEYAGRLTMARRYLEQALARAQAADDTAGVAITLAKLGLVATRQRRLAEARWYLDQSLARFKRTYHWFFEATALSHLAHLQIELGKFRLALRTLDRAEAFFIAHPADTHSRRLAQLWGMRAHCQAQLGQLGKARRWLAKTLSALECDGFSPTATAVVLRDIRATRTIQQLAAQSVL